MELNIALPHTRKQTWNRIIRVAQEGEIPEVMDVKI
jgi:hypothetical protein